jgi:4-hydroxybenzoate polyprenyltransferase
MERKTHATEEKTLKVSKPAAYQPWNFHNWMTFLSERAPPLFFLMMAAGPCLSILYSKTEGFPIEKFIWAILGEQVLLLLVRIMDDVKDYEKDKVVHPDRPLPRGLIKFEEVSLFLNIAMLSTVVYGVLLGLRFGTSVAVSYELQVVYGYLMYVEFGVGERLEKNPFLYSFTHEISAFIIPMFLTSLRGDGWFTLEGFFSGCLIFSSFFSYDICRKLDPYLPKLKGTYLVICGKWPVFAATSVLSAMGMIASYVLDLHGLLWPLQLALVGSVLLLTVLPPQSRSSKRHKPVEILSAVNLILHLWVPFFAKLLSSQQ